MRVAVLVVAATVMTACIGGPDWVRFGPPKPSQPRFPGSEGGDAGLPGGLTRKRVTYKEEPATLRAGDGSTCTVTERRFAKIREGDRVLCAWAGGS